MWNLHLKSMALTVLLLAVFVPYNYFWMAINKSSLQLHELLEEVNMLHIKIVHTEELLARFIQENDLLKEEIKELRKEKMISGVISTGRPKTARVAITIDDGWDARWVNQALDYLKVEGVQATLFPTGSAVQADPGLWRRAVEDGHELGNHTFSHRFLTNLAEGEIYSEINRWQEAVNSALGYTYPTVFFRPPGMAGFTGNPVLESYYRLIISRHGLITVLWDIETCYTLYNHEGPLKAGKNPSATRVASYIAGEAAAGSIILLHFTPTDIESLPALIRGLRERGLEPVTLTELLFAPVHPPLPSQTLTEAQATSFSPLENSKVKP